MNCNKIKKISNKMDMIKKWNNKMINQVIIKIKIIIIYEKKKN